MWTGRRLTEAYQSARIERLGDDSRYVFISDCHRGDGSLSDEFVRNQNIYLNALQYYYEGGFVYVEVGDGDELWENRHFKHIKEAHFEALDSIKRFFDDDRFILLWGNHNNYLRDPAYVERNYFVYYDEHVETTHDFMVGVRPCEALVLRHDVTGQEIFVIHGHQGDFANDQGWFATMLSVKYFWHYMHAFGLRNPASPVRNAYKRHKIEKNFSKWILQHRKALICGHTHRLKYPRSTEPPYFNTGSCIYPSSITAIEIADGQILLARWKIHANADGILQVTRDVVRGPDPIERFDIR